MSITRQALRASVTIAAVLLLASCGSEGKGVTLPAGAEELEPCRVSTIDVSDLATEGAPGCDLDGSALRIPDSQRMRIDTPGAVLSTSTGPDAERFSMVVNWGVPGVGASITDSDNNVMGIWGSSPEAIKLHTQQIALSEPISAD